VTVALSGKEISVKLEKQFPGSIVEAGENSLLVKSEFLLDLASFFKAAPEFDFDYLTNITAVDYYEYFEVIYQLVSLKHNHSLVLKTRCEDQEREIHDLLGIKFEGHPNMRPILLWEGFQGYPLRRDYL